MSILSSPLNATDPEMWALINQESTYQTDHLSLIASENYASRAILEAQGSILTNQYAEGYPGKRYYGGCEIVDQVEQLAIDRAKQLFGADYANVQPHSGSSANQAVYQALLSPGDRLLAMGLTCGGHLTHGFKVNQSGSLFDVMHYGVNQIGQIDLDEVRDLAKKHQPKLIIAGFSTFSGIIDWKAFANIAQEVGAWFLADMAHVAGLVAAGLYPSPIPHADVVTTTTHKTLRGARGGLILAKANTDLEKKLNSGVFPGIQGGPLVQGIAAKAVTFHEAMQPDFIRYQQAVLSNAQAMADHWIQSGFNVVSGGTTNHQFLLDFSDQAYTGLEAEQALSQVNILTNRNTVPNEPRSPMNPSGLRIGTPAISTRGLTVESARALAQLMIETLQSRNEPKAMASIQTQVLDLCQRHPLYNG